MSVEENKAIVRRVIDAWNERDLEAAAQHFDHERYIWHGPNGEEYSASEHGFSDQGLRNEFEAFPDIRYEIADMIAEGDKVVLRLVEPATHTGGEWLGIAPSGKQITLRSTVILRIKDGKVVEEWDAYDMLGTMQQLGASGGL